MKEKKKHLPVNLDPKLSAKFQYVCKRNASSANSVLVRYIMKTVQTYESKFGAIQLEEAQHERLKK